MHGDDGTRPQRSNELRRGGIILGRCPDHDRKRRKFEPAEPQLAQRVFRRRFELARRTRQRK